MLNIVLAQELRREAGRLGFDPVGVARVPAGPRLALRTAALLSQGAASNAANDQAQAALTAADAQVTSVQAQLDTITLQIARTEVKSPVAGLITARNAQIGAIASSQTGPMFVITRDGAHDVIRAAVQVNHGVAQRLALGVQKNGGGAGGGHDARHQRELTAYW